MSNELSPEEAGRRAQELLASYEERERSNPHKRPKTNTLDVSTVLAHAGVSGNASSSTTAASHQESLDNISMSPALHMSTTFTRPAHGQYAPSDSIYARADNPTRLLLEREIAQLECHNPSSTSPDFAGSDNTTTAQPVCCAFASGMMAASSIILAHSTPLHVLLPHDLYHGVPTVLADVFTRFQVTTHQVDMTNESGIFSGIPNEGDVIVWIETPSNPKCHVINIQAVRDALSKTKKEIQARTTIVVDSTLAPPVITRPLLLGADIVVHSATKYLAGHSDALIGVATTSPWTCKGTEIGARLKQVQIAVGGVASPMDCWLTLRGLRTLQVRVERQCKTAQKIAEFLSQNTIIQAVHYPGLGSHPQHKAARHQMKGGYGGVMSLEMKDASWAMALAGALQVVQRATSLGGTESLIEHRASIEPPHRRTSPPGLLRLSLGLEDPDDLIADFSRAIEICKEVFASD